MARIRTIKPEFFTSEDVLALSYPARLLYIALWCEADKAGRLRWKPRTFKIRYLPADDVDVDALCDEIVTCGLVILYGDGLAWIPGFEKHQHVNPRETPSSLPVPPDWKEGGPKKVGKTVREAVFERDGHKCVRCGSDEILHVDHILPQSIGGPHIAENLRTLCRTCNVGRPVAGDALVKDLARDGFTVEKLRVKFGIDASIPELTDREEGREGREGTKEQEHADPGGPSPGPSATGSDPPEDPTKRLFDLGVSVLTGSGHSESSARTLVGKLRKAIGDDEAIKVVLKASKMTHPAAYLGRCMSPKPKSVQLC